MKLEEGSGRRERAERDMKGRNGRELGGFFPLVKEERLEVLILTLYVRYSHVRSNRYTFPSYLSTKCKGPQAKLGYYRV